MRFYFLIVFIQLSLTFHATAQDTLHVGDPFETHLLNLNTTQIYVHYQELKDGRSLPHSMKTITINNSDSELSIIQKEFSKTQTKTLETVVDARTLITHSHIRTANNNRESFYFSRDEVTGISDDEKAINNNFSKTLNKPTFNFEIDFILLESINWSERDTAVLNFYHPGGKLPPADYTFTKEKEDQLSLTGGITIDCWVIYTDYNGQPPARFWISKKTNHVIRQETDAMNMAGFNFVKQLIITQ